MMTRPNLQLTRGQVGSRPKIYVDLRLSKAFQQSQEISEKEITDSERWVSCLDINLQQYIHFGKSLYSKIICNAELARQRNVIKDRSESRLITNVKLIVGGLLKLITANPNAIESWQPLSYNRWIMAALAIIIAPNSTRARNNQGCI